MPVLTKEDVEQYTLGRVTSSDSEKMLARGLNTARRFCGWHVTPVTEPAVEIRVDGPGGRLLRLPTLRLVELVSIDDNGTVLLPADLYASTNGMVEKRSGGTWSSRLGAIKVTLKHGFVDADDFNAAVLSWIDRAALAPAGGRPRVVGPFQYPDEPAAPGSTFTGSERALLEQYRLERPA